ELLDMAVRLDIINKSGAWFNYGETRLGHGRDNVKAYIRDNPEFFEEIEAKVRENFSKLTEKPGTVKAGPKKLGRAVSNMDVTVEVDDKK
ncbi:MAG: DNA recombination/repair protein RecA, partial [Oscillospiraceae bacterium]|nr:DNA recombination/repair protein RecA [Oscillospiraceae bacterium]